MPTVAAAQALPVPVSEGITSGAQRILFLSALLLAPAVVGAWFLGDAGTVLGVVVGGAAALLNFLLLARLVVKTTSAQTAGPGALLVQLMSKFGALGLGLAGAVFLLGVDAMGLLLGLSVTLAAMPLNLFSEWAAQR